MMKKRGLSKRILAFMLSLMMVIALVPMNAITVKAEGVPNCPHCGGTGFVCMMHDGTEHAGTGYSNESSCRKACKASENGCGSHGGSPLTAECDYCNRGSACEHIIKSFESYQKNADYHWKKSCVRCGEIKDQEYHTLTNGKCSICGYACKHSFISSSVSYLANADYHWKKTCGVCGEIIDQESHTDTNNDGICDTCRYSYSNGAILPGNNDDEFNLTIYNIPSEGGSTYCETRLISYSWGTSATFTAEPNPGYRFKGWYAMKSSNASGELGTCLSSEETYTITPSAVDTYKTCASELSSKKTYSVYIAAVYEDSTVHTHSKDETRHHEAKEASCIDGNIEYWECSCGKKIDSSLNEITDVTIPATGTHDFVNGKCSRCNCDDDGTGDSYVDFSKGHYHNDKYVTYEFYIDPSKPDFFTEVAATKDRPGTKEYVYCSKCDRYFEEDQWIPIPDIEEWKKGKGKIEYHEWDKNTGKCTICGITCSHNKGITKYGGQVCVICGLDAMYADEVLELKSERAAAQNYGYISKEDILSPNFNLTYNLNPSDMEDDVDKHPYTEPEKVLSDWLEDSWVGYIQQPIYFGTNNGQAQRWYITGYQNDGLVLLADPTTSYGEQVYSDAADNREYKTDYGTYKEGEKPETVGKAHYGASKLREKLNSIQQDEEYFSSAEQKLMNTTRVYINDSKNSSVYYVDDILHVPGADGTHTNDADYCGALLLGANSEEDLKSGIRIDYFKEKYIALDSKLNAIISTKRAWTHTSYEDAIYEPSEDKFYACINVWAERGIKASFEDYEEPIVPTFNLSIVPLSFLSAAKPATSQNNVEVVNYGDGTSWYYNRVLKGQSGSNNPQPTMYARWDSALNADGTVTTDRISSSAVVTSTPWESYITVRDAKEDEYLYVQYMDNYSSKVFSVKTTDIVNGVLTPAMLYGDENATILPYEMQVWIEKTAGDGLTYAKTANYAESKEKVYEIKTAQDFLTVIDWSKNFIITNDIDFGNKEINPRGTLRGDFNGNGKKFINLKIVETETDTTINHDDTGYYDYIDMGGLFRNVAGSIRNLTLDKGEMIINLNPTEEDTKDYYYYGAFAGMITPGGEISGCTNNLKITASFSSNKGVTAVGFGGIAGIACCSMTPTKKEYREEFSYLMSWCAAGYCGVELTSCVNNGDISVTSFTNEGGSLEVGGICGSLFETVSTVENLTNTGKICVENVLARYLFTAGIMGRFPSTLGDTQKLTNSGDICISNLAGIKYISGVIGKISDQSLYYNNKYFSNIRENYSFVEFRKPVFRDITNTANIYAKNNSGDGGISRLLSVYKPVYYRSFATRSFENNVNTGNVYITGGQCQWNIIDGERYGGIGDIYLPDSIYKVEKADKESTSITLINGSWEYTKDWLNYSGTEDEDNIIEIDGQKYVKLELTVADDKASGKDEIVIPGIIRTDDYTDTDKKDLIVDSIAAYAFGKATVGSIVVPETVTKLGTNAFGENMYIEFLGTTPPEGIKQAIREGAKIHIPAGAEEAYQAVLGDGYEIDSHVHSFNKGVCECGTYEGKITNKNYPTSIIYGSTVPKPVAENFEINSGVEPTFEWYQGDVITGELTGLVAGNKVPDTEGTFTLVVKTGGTRGEKVYSAAELRIKVVISKEALKGTVTVSGTMKEGETLTASASVTNKYPGDPSYTWYSVEGDIQNTIANGTDNTYVLTADEVGKTIKVQVSYSNCEGTIEGTAKGTATHTDADSDGKCDICGKQASDTDGIFIRKIEDQPYTGKAITPKLYVYDNGSGRELIKNKDYTVKFSKNVNVGTAKVTITAKGNYSNTETETFNIVAQDISTEAFSAKDMVIKPTGKGQKPAPALKWNGKTVSSKVYTYQYFIADEEGNPTGDALTSIKDSGRYVIVITAKANGNFTGTRNVAVTIVEDVQKLVSKLTVSTAKTQSYTGEAVIPKVTVKDGKKKLTESTDGVTGDYTVAYKNNVKVGTATAVITGINNYVGTKSVTFKITGTPVTKATVEGITPIMPYTGNDITFDGIKVYFKATKTAPEKILTESTDGVTGDYTVSYKKNISAGTGIVVITGINGYTGVLNKNFKITAAKQADMADRFSVEFTDPDVETDGIVYSKGGAKPAVTVKFINGDGTERVLAQKMDYVLAYSKNTAVNDCSNEKNLPAVKVTFKGSYSGSVTKNFKITAKDISTVKVAVSDKTYAKKAGAYKSTVKLTDADGKVLVASKDYKAVEYSITKDGQKVVLGSKDIVKVDGPDGTLVTVTIKAKDGGNYTGETSCTYRVTKAAISSAKVVQIKSQTYTGSEITLTSDDITVKTSKLGAALEYGTDYKIVEGSYSKNVNKGTASVTIQGLGNYGGTRKVNFTIKAKGFIWWWKR